MFAQLVWTNCPDNFYLLSSPDVYGRVIKHIIIRSSLACIAWHCFLAGQNIDECSSLREHIDGQHLSPPVLAILVMVSTWNYNL